VRSGSAAALLMAAVAITPATASKRDNSLRVADEQVLDNVDPYFNSVRIEVLLAHQIWDTLIYRDPATGGYKGPLATSWKWIDDNTRELRRIRARNRIRPHHEAQQFQRPCVQALPDC
jgi:peptide/nickel transport system substrate-binding protein